MSPAKTSEMEMEPLPQQSLLATTMRKTLNSMSACQAREVDTVNYFLLFWCCNCLYEVLFETYQPYLSAKHLRWKMSLASKPQFLFIIQRCKEDKELVKALASWSANDLRIVEQLEDMTPEYARKIPIEGEVFQWCSETFVRLFRPERLDPYDKKMKDILQSNKAFLQVLVRIIMMPKADGGTCENSERSNPSTPSRPNLSAVFLSDHRHSENKGADATKPRKVSNKYSNKSQTPSNEIIDLTADEEEAVGPTNNTGKVVQSQSEAIQKSNMVMIPAKKNKAVDTDVTAESGPLESKTSNDSKRRDTCTTTLSEKLQKETIYKKISETKNTLEQSSERPAKRSRVIENTPAVAATDLTSKKWNQDLLNRTSSPSEGITVWQFEVPDEFFLTPHLKLKKPFFAK